MQRNETKPGALALEIMLYVGVAITAVFGLLRNLFGPLGLGWMLPEWAWNVSERIFGPYFLGDSPSIRAQLAQHVMVSTEPKLYSYDDQLVPAGRGEFSGPFEAQVNVYGADFPQRFGLLGGQLLAVLLTLAVLLVLIKIVRTLRADEGPLTLTNSNRLRLIAVLVAVGGTVSALLVAWGEWLVLAESAIAPFVANRFNVNLVPLAVGAGIYVFAEVFRRGAVMHDDLARVV